MNFSSLRNCQPEETGEVAHATLSSWTAKSLDSELVYEEAFVDDSSSSSDDGLHIKSGDSEFRRQFIRRHISKKYYVTSDSLRYRLLKLLDSNNITIKKAAEILKINYSTAKSIVQIYKREGRICKKTINSRLSTPLSSILQKYEEDPNYSGAQDEEFDDKVKSSGTVPAIEVPESKSDSGRRYTTHEENLVPLEEECDASIIINGNSATQGGAMEDYMKCFFNPDILIQSRYLPVPSALFGKDLRTIDEASSPSSSAGSESD
mmetsp:Transcript_64402/g.73931  ORF Transcript_64402/g.73931 Transcript_64402/m.73931 type:complete len:263 (-) Transcript_64402:1726-2514(-)|eukprot:CAMPEP_0115010708 /NCGR_PEP_ID=MMETSP0216-20121206/23495_1 /TAXON_ID=223996 /ORGANISM="Protocruzia adherens, Strain Boccale" /LENGTH=262 /DNA_ID=CAMNT_0002379011 /DNA_START=149 /DNA_END=937 /DNA_ORIENTATION=-